MTSGGWSYTPAFFGHHHPGKHGKWQLKGLTGFPGDGPRMVVFRADKEASWIVKGPGFESWSDSKGNAALKHGQGKKMMKDADLPLFVDAFGDGQRMACFRASEGYWYIKGPGPEDWSKSISGNLKIAFGQKGDIPFSANFFGDGERLAVWRPSKGKWLVKGPGTEDWNKSEGNVEIQCGKEGDIPLIADFFGDGLRFATYRPSKGMWAIKGLGKGDWSDSESGNETFIHGKEGDIPLVIPHDDGKGSRCAVFRPSEGAWYIKGPGVKDWDNCLGNERIEFGKKGDIPMVMITEKGPRLCVFQPDTGDWYIKGPGDKDYKESQGNIGPIQSGKKGDIPMLPS